MTPRAGVRTAVTSFAWFAWPRWTPHRTIWPTRDGWWFLGVSLGLGVVAINTSNNLLYLLASLLLGLVVVSGLLSEMTMRGVVVSPLLPGEFRAGGAAVLGALVANRKRRLASHFLALEAGGGEGGVRALHLWRLGPGAERLVSWEVGFARRGRQRLPGLRVTTRFPFGLFVKAGPPLHDREVVVFPSAGPVPASLGLAWRGEDGAPTRRRGRGGDLHSLRDYLPGDDPRLLHWRRSARTGSLTVREPAAEGMPDVRIVLEPVPGAAPEAVERGISAAASLAEHLLAAGASVALSGPGLALPLAHGREQRRCILTALALWAPGGDPPPGGGRGGGREVRVRLG